MQGNLPTLESPHCELALIKRTLHSRTSSALYTLCEKKNYKQKTYFRRSENFLTFRSAIFLPRLQMAELSLLH